MKKLALSILFSLGIIAIGNSAVSAQMMKTDNPMVGGAAMYKTKDIIDNAVNSADHTTLVAAVKAAGLVDTLKGKGPFTVFAPVNSAFDALPAGTVEMLLKPENKGTLTKILTYHVVAGNLDSKAICQGHCERQRQGRVHDRRRWKTLGMDGWLSPGPEGRKGRDRQSDDRGRSPVERCDTRDRYHHYAQLAGTFSNSGPLRATCSCLSTRAHFFVLRTPVE